MIVWLVSYPQSGDALVRHLLHQIFGIEVETVEEQKQSLTTLRQADTPTYLTTHHHPDQTIYPEDKVLYLLRDGRESTLLYYQAIASDYTLREVIVGEVPLGNWGTHLGAWDPQQRPNTLLIHYEKLLQDPYSQIPSIAHFLVCTPQEKPLSSLSAYTTPITHTYSPAEENLFYAKHSLRLKEYGYTIPPHPSAPSSELKISVITPSLNAGEYIERAIESVLDQHYPNFEHIVIDAQSTDNTLEILRRYPHLKWISEPDTGQSNAMNKGFALASGDIIVILNHDDYFIPNAFHSVIPYFEAGEQFVVGDLLVHDMTQREVVVSPQTTHEAILHHWRKRDYITPTHARSSFPNNPVQYFYTKAVQHACPFNESNHFTMDIEFLIDASASYSFCKIDTILGVYFRREDAKAVVATSDALHYWTFETFAYIDRYIQHWKPEKLLQFKAAQSQGYLEHISHKLLQTITQQNKEIKQQQQQIEQQTQEIAETTHTLSEVTHQLTSLMESIEEITTHPITSQPLKKLKAYQTMLDRFDHTRKERPLCLSK